MAEKIFASCGWFWSVTAWFHAQPGNETRTTDSSLKCLAAALHLRPMMSNFWAMCNWLSD